MTRAKLDAAVLAWTRERPWRIDDARFEGIALALFAFQFEACAPYANFCRSIGRTPQDVIRANEIPAIPTGAFKEFELRCFPAERTMKTFRTSGTSVERRGELHLDTLELYESSLLASLRTLFLTDLEGQHPSMRFLAKNGTEAPDSSLTHMFETLAREEGSTDSRFDWQDDRLDIVPLEQAIAKARERDEPLIVAGTSFAFVHLLDQANSDAGRRASESFRLPGGSRILETGGFKGRSREIPREILRTEIARFFGLPETHVINQYGMTELGSQFYDSTLVDPNGPRRKLAPPWTRVRFVDPDSGSEVEDGEVGQIIIHDLVNTSSLAVLQTADLGRSILDATGQRIGFDVLGREAGAEARGCSIATDIMLEAAKS